MVALLIDMIIVDSADPFGPGEGLFIREFYGNCYKALAFWLFFREVINSKKEEQANESGGVACTLKHFPGHGDTATDSLQMKAVTDSYY